MMLVCNDFGDVFSSCMVLLRSLSKSALGDHESSSYQLFRFFSGPANGGLDVAFGDVFTIQRN